MCWCVLFRQPFLLWIDPANVKMPPKKKEEVRACASVCVCLSLPSLLVLLA